MTVIVSCTNFEIADTGTLSVVEPKGNGRMCLTLPRTQITVMNLLDNGRTPPSPS